MREFKDKAQMYLRAAIKAAERSPFSRFRTGCILLGGDIRPDVLGWSHPSELQLASYMSIHAEMHAMMRASPTSAWDLFAYRDIYIATLTAKGNATSAKPCAACAANLYDFGVRRVYYTVSTHRDLFQRNINFNRLDLHSNNDKELLKRYKTRKEAVADGSWR